MHAAALASTADTDPSEDHGGRGVPALARSLRLYALATRTLIASSALSGFAGVHDHVGAILVSDAGAILAARINTGSYRHAEVSLLLSWFRDNPEARTLPAKSIVLSTLIPCRQCTRYLSLAKAPDTLVRFDEADEGRSGRVGERIAERIDMGAAHRSGSTAVPPVRPCARACSGGDDSRPRNDITGREHRPRSRAACDLQRRRGGMSRLDRSREARQAILHAAVRQRDVDAEERRIEAHVSACLAEWIIGAAYTRPLPHESTRPDEGRDSARRWRG